MSAVSKAVAVGLFGLGIFAVYQARQLPAAYGGMSQDVLGPGFFPFWVGVAVAAVAVIILISEIRGRGSEEPFLPREGRWPVLVLLAGTIFYVALFEYLGFVIDTVLFVGLTLWLLGQRPTVSLGAAVVVGLGLYLVFVRWLGVPLPPGPFGF